MTQDTIFFYCTIIFRSTMHYFFTFDNHSHLHLFTMGSLDSPFHLNRSFDSWMKPREDLWQLGKDLLNIIYMFGANIHTHTYRNISILYQFSHDLQPELFLWFTKPFSCSWTVCSCCHLSLSGEIHSL